MRATPAHTLLKMEAGFEHVPLLMSGLRRQQCLLIGKGKEMPDPLGRSGLHLFGVDLVGPDGQVINVKSRVPQPFLNLMKGGKGPKSRTPLEAEAAGRRAARTSGTWETKKAPVRVLFYVKCFVKVGTCFRANPGVQWTPSDSNCGRRFASLSGS